MRVSRGEVLWRGSGGDLSFKKGPTGRGLGAAPPRKRAKHEKIPKQGSVSEANSNRLRVSQATFPTRIKKPRFWQACVGCTKIVVLLPVIGIPFQVFLRKARTEFFSRRRSSMMGKKKSHDSRAQVNAGIVALFTFYGFLFFAVLCKVRLERLEPATKRAQRAGHGLPVGACPLRCFSLIRSIKTLPSQPGTIRAGNTASDEGSSGWNPTLSARSAQVTDCRWAHAHYIVFL